MILSEAVDEGLIGANPCRRLRIGFADRPERPHADTDEVDALAGRMAPDAGLMTITAAYTGLRWGELAGLQWIRTYLDDDPRIEIDPEFGALHEVRGRLELGPPKTLAKALNLLDWAMDDEFWRANIGSLPKFRAQYDQLRLRALAEHDQKRRAGPGAQRESLTTIAMRSADDAVDEWERRQAARRHVSWTAAGRGAIA